MKNLTTIQTAKLLVNSFYEETPLDASITDTIETANTKIADDFELAKKMAFKCADFIRQEHFPNNPSVWNQKREQFYTEVKSIIETLTIEETFKN